MAPDRFEWARLGAQRLAMNWAEIAISRGWAFDEVFNCPEPFTNLSAMGAAWCVDDAVVLAIETDAILIKTPTGSRQRIYRRSGDDPHRWVGVEVAVGGVHYGLRRNTRSGPDRMGH